LVGFTAKIFKEEYMNLGKAASYIILIAEDDEDDYLFVIEALKEAGIGNQAHWVKDGEELMDFLNGSLQEENKKTSPIAIILLDLNMPKKDGLEALEEIKSHAIFRKIPVIVLTTSGEASEITHAYELGANSYIQKPIRYSEYLKTIEVLRNYWFSAVRIPL